MAVSQTRGVIPRSELTDDLPRADSFEKYKVCVSGDLVLNRFNAYRGSLGVAPDAGMVSPDYLVLRPRHSGVSRFLEYWLRSSRVSNEMLRAMGGLGAANPDESGFSRIDVAALMRLEVEVNGVAEQRRIAEFLDRETAQIDELIAKQEQLISTLAERLQSRVEMLVTGADKLGRDRRETGVEWWPQLPSNWGTPKVTHHFEVVLGKMLDAGREPLVGEHSMPYVRAANIQETELRLDDLNSMPMNSSEISRLDLRAGDLLVVEGGAVGVNQYLDDDLPGISFQKTVNRVRPRGAGSSEYLGFVLDVLRWRGVIDMICNKSTIAHFTAEKLAALRVPWPPISRQFEIAQEVRELRNDVSLLSARALGAIRLLRERRQALISAAVTGQTDVGGAS